ncbi:MAG: TAXI family TRAP transporter solute-binding subunit [FCB group bacterium]|nr:TAXI family TRAP transporter solute-binding subunit [FCB group bacterium]
MKKNKLIIIIILFFIFHSLYSVDTIIKIATGNQDGVYYKIGNSIKTLLKTSNSDLKIEIIETSGSVENAKLLINKDVDIAFMQSDIAYNLYQQYSFSANSTIKIQGIAALYTELIQIIGRKELFIEKLSDLSGEPVSIGSIGSGTAKNATDILLASNFKNSDVDKKNYSFSEMDDAFQSREINAAFVTSGLKFKPLINIANDVNFIPIDKETVIKLRDKYPYFVSSVIPANTYEGQGEPVSTVGVRALLVTNSNLDADIIEKVCSTIYSNLGQLSKVHPAASKIKLSKAKNGMIIPIHSGAKTFYKKKSLINTLIFLLSLSLIAIIVLTNKKIVKKFSKRFLRQLRHNIHFRIGIIILLLFIFGSLGTYYFEHNINEEFDTLYKAIWATMIYLLSGFDIDPITPGGKISAFLLLIGGIGILGTVVGNLATIFMKEGVEKMPKNVKGHIAICNWSKRGEKIIEELHHPSAEPDTEIIILTDGDVNERELREKSKRYANVYFIKGKPTSYDTLKSARIHQAKSVIILSDPNDAEPDPKTILSCLAIRQLSKDLKEKYQPHIIAELMDRTNRKMALDAGANEIVSAGFYRTGIMLQSALYHNLSDIFHELLIYEKNSSSIFIIEKDQYSDIFIGKDFQKASEIISNNCNDINPVILIGVRRTIDSKTTIILNPLVNGESKNGKFDVFNNDDAMVVIARNHPDLSKIKK